MNRPNTISRRGFVQHMVGGLAAAGLPMWYAQEIVAADEAKAETKAEGIRMGAIGIGSPASRGLAIYNDARRQKGVRYVAACDVDANHLERAVGIMKKDFNTSDIKGYEDYRELLGRADIDAVTIATPDQWHAIVAIEAMRRGKDVYCEKPLTLTIEEALILIKVQKETGRVFQTGSQQRSDARFRLACELVRNGRIGKIKRVECRIGGNPKGTFKTAPVPKGLNWDFWQGPCEAVEFVPQRCHYEYRWWYEYSGGKMTDWGAHHLDIAQWGLGMDGSGPVKVVGEGEKPNDAPNSYNCHPNFKVTYTYANGTEVIAQSGGENGVLFEGENGTIFVSRGTIRASDKKLLEEPLGKDAIRLEVTNGHMNNFMECLSTRKKPICNVEVGASSVIVCHTGVIATRLGKALTWDPATHRFGEAEANAMISRPMRKPWKLDV
ncbi:Gfo/Idh/MocA family protein [Tuwongella immobilis]|uniref:Gfo/Idh/MocA-like oxidoreductase N-terminal domain-containing protein n=1 Tax=Tuwongella immobilis TaxID=692036 RepID=A0A6C2YUK1_9BACT|nr:Gfo/Idh/MocA family oxidoreductase [Tuwongella immobilis]VIP04595.1 nadh-dependent dehydrogenase : Oxidoreductase domain protein OS=Isosphaera pallida (strain ATCC 43644 / DSM 9630 / IS1B) GN=Isop_2812 PE=4 SV=1: GFO_IDH_MocA [Tuwongella immobilis]VTS06551.1 nadh-dependent dehydrogenase : Oxidoreductase domain protein OS=Isosphaera pallida (strain ATCC 43644 / DSM 9630 / IS1B) GN=Isop_2812 PE=4 SV=1: GFO_IDH_MocA [Tuwongella immobilis]